MALADDPLWTVLGRRGRAAVVDVLAGAPTKTWNARGLAHAAGVHPVVAARAVRELAALGAVETIRPGRDLVVQWRGDSPAARALVALEAPRLRARTAEVFATALAHLPGAEVVWWREPADDVADPFTPTRIAVIVREDEEAAWEGIGPALDALRRVGLPPPEVAVVTQATLDGDDPLVRAVGEGVHVQITGNLRRIRYA